MKQNFADMSSDTQESKETNCFILFERFHLFIYLLRIQDKNYIYSARG